MINELLFMNGYGVYVLSAFSFTLLSFSALYLITKIQFVKEQNKFVVKIYDTFINVISISVNDCGICSIFIINFFNEI